MRVSDLLLLGLSSLAAGSPLGSHVVHEKRNALPVAWTKHSRAPKDTILPVRIGLTQRNLEHSDRFLDDISDPESPNFGKQKLLYFNLCGANWMIRKALDSGESRQHFRTAPEGL
jgi:hypothetical protein